MVRYEGNVIHWTSGLNRLSLFADRNPYLYVCGHLFLIVLTMLGSLRVLFMVVKQLDELQIRLISHDDLENASPRNPLVSRVC